MFSADGVVRCVLARGRFELDASGRPSRGIIIDIRPSRMSDHAYVRSERAVPGSPLERAAEHCIAAHRAMKDLEDPKLNLLSAMLLLEVGRKLAKLESSRRHNSLY